MKTKIKLNQESVGRKCILKYKRIYGDHPMLGHILAVSEKGTAIVFQDGDSRWSRCFSKQVLVMAELKYFDFV